MSDSYLVSMMCNWARWAMRGMDGGVGYPKQSAFTNNMPHGGVEDYTPEVNESALEIDACMQSLSVIRIDLYVVLYLHYRRNDLALVKKLDHLGCCKKTYYNRIDIGHNQMLGLLNDLACGIKLPK
jgi:hypothetical protein